MWTQTCHTVAVSGSWPAVSRYLCEQILTSELEFSRQRVCHASTNPRTPWWHQLVILALGRQRQETPQRSVASQHILLGELQASETSHHKYMVGSTWRMAVKDALWPPWLHMQTYRLHRYKYTHTDTQIHRHTEIHTHKCTQIHTQTHMYRPTDTHKHTTHAWSKGCNFKDKTQWCLLCRLLLNLGKGLQLLMFEKEKTDGNTRTHPRPMRHWLTE